MTEKDLHTLLKSINPESDDRSYVFVSLAPQDFAKLDIPVLCFFQEAEGISIILEKSLAIKKKLDFDGTWSLITCKVNSALEAVGFLAKMSEALAEKNIPVNAVSAYHHDHLFIPSTKLQEALKVLKSLAK